jgi:putative tricarboxylic transport membrane protein
MRLNDAVLGLLLIVLAGAMAWISRGFPAVPGQEYGASVFPTLVAVGFAGCGAVLIAKGLRAHAPAIAWQDWTRDRRGRLNVFATIAAVVLYVLVAGTLGFIPTIALILAVLLRLFGVGWAVTAVVALATPLVMQYLFGNLLLVPLPWGLLEPVRW